MLYFAIYYDAFDCEYIVFGDTLSECVSKLEVESGAAMIFDNVNFFEAKQIKVKQEYIIE